MIYGIFLSLLSSFSLFASEKPFCIIIHSYNNSPWIEQNLESVFEQNYQNYHVVYIDDGSTDNTPTLVADYVKKRKQEERFTLLLNKERQGPLASMCQGASLCDSQEIILDMNGDDWLAHEEVLNYLNSVYSDADVWMTYGQFIKYPHYQMGFAHQVPQNVIENHTFRSCGGAVTYLVTFYAGLFHQIDRNDFLYDGTFIKRAGDLAYIIPILEMSSHHSRFIPDVLYVYNYNLPLHPDKEPCDFETQMDGFIRNKTPYLPLETLPQDKVLPIYSQISSLTTPTLQDYRFIQDYLSFGKRENIEHLADMTRRMKEIKLIGNTPNEFPLTGKISVNCEPDEKENCLLLYSTFNLRYPQGLERLLNQIKASDFKGHILYRLGGWPNEEEGDITLSHVPYAFKLSFFREAKRRGYKKALWLDTAVTPLVSLNQIFAMIEQKGCFVMGNAHQIAPFSRPESTSFFGLNHSYTDLIPSCSAGLFGVDFTKPIGNTIIHWWHKAALDKDAFFSKRSDQNALSIILHQLGIYDFVPLRQMPHSLEEIQFDSLFLLNRWSVL